MGSIGVVFQEKSDFSHTVDALATDGGKTLGGLISKLHGLKDFGFKTFETTVLFLCGAGT